MKIAFRVDASSEIGTGHFMRCLTLADALAVHDARIRFISRRLPPHFRAMLAARGYGFSALVGPAQAPHPDSPAHAQWLGTSQEQDASDSVAALSDQHWDWLAIDHYALDARWETRLRDTSRRIFVIDDLADRQHDCDVLLDQNPYLEMESRYDGKLPAACRRLLGPRYALLRDEFRRLHEQVRERSGPVKRIMVFFGGVDADNYTEPAIGALADLRSRDWCIDVVIGAQHPARSAIEAACASHGYSCHVQTAAIAQLMAQADLAIGAGGTATWERCCVGLPTLTLCVAANQRKLIEDAGVAGLIYAPPLRGDLRTALRRYLQALVDDPDLRTRISRLGIATVDGRGSLRVVEVMRALPDRCKC